jgi:hypothetical protein
MFKTLNFGHLIFEFVSSFDIRISDLRVSGKWVKSGALLPNFKLPFLGPELMRRGTRQLAEVFG